MNNFWKNKKVVVTGASGFIGSHAVKALLEKGSEVTAVVSPNTEENRLKLIFGENLKKIKVGKANLQILEDCIKATERQDIILNFAALDGGSSFKTQHPAEIFRVNTEITLNMLEAAVRNKINRFLLMSSIEVYPKGLKEPIKEDYELKENFQEDINGYAWSKRLGEIAAKMYSKQYGLKIAIARAGNVYGPGDNLSKGRVIPTFINKLLRKEQLDLFDDGAQKIQLVYTSDLLEALFILIENYAVCDPINIVGNKTVTIKELSQVISVLISNNLNVKFPEKMPNIISNIKAQKVINLTEKVDLIKGLKEVIKFYDGQ